MGMMEIRAYWCAGTDLRRAAQMRKAGLAREALDDIGAIALHGTSRCRGIAAERIRCLAERHPLPRVRTHAADWLREIETRSR